MIHSSIAKGVIILREDGKELGGQTADQVCVSLVGNLDIRRNRRRRVHSGERDRCRGVTEADPPASQGDEVLAKDQLMLQGRYNES
jgi:hypothetical protein